MPSNCLSFSNPAIWQRLTLGAGFLDPIIASAGGIVAVSHLGDHALEPKLACTGEHLSTNDRPLNLCGSAIGMRGLSESPSLGVVRRHPLTNASLRLGNRITLRLFEAL